MTEQPPFKWRHTRGEDCLVVHPLVSTISTQFSRPGGASWQNEALGRPYDHLSLGPALRPELEKRCQPHLKRTTDSWHIDETYEKIKGVWMYLSYAVDTQEDMVEFRFNQPVTI